VVWEDGEESRVGVIEGGVFHEKLADNGECYVENGLALRHYKLHRRDGIKRPQAKNLMQRNIEVVVAAACLLKHVEPLPLDVSLQSFYSSMTGDMAIDKW
jgi:hypothetical protein